MTSLAKGALVGFFLAVIAFMCIKALSPLPQDGRLSSVRIASSATYPNSQYTTGIVATSDFKALTAIYHGLTYSKSVRNVTNAEKTQLTQQDPQGCALPHEVDHFIPLALGGSNDVKNLWCEPEDVLSNGINYGYHVKDKLENYLVIQMKSGAIAPADAQQCILKDWVACYQKYFSGRYGGFDLAVDGDDETI